MKEKNTMSIDLPVSRAGSYETMIRSFEDLLKTAETPIDAETVRAIVREELSGQEPRKVDIHVNGVFQQQVQGPLPIPFFRVVRRMVMRMNTLLVGPAGCGKTTMARKAAEALGLRFGHITLSAGMSEGHLLGRLLPTGKGGQFEYNLSQFVDFYENGGVYLLDELDAADANTLLVINTALANGEMAVPARTANPVAVRHPDFVCIACANTFGNGANRQYVGREQLDAATLDRFRAAFITCDYDSNIESNLVDRDILAWGRAMRAKIAETQLRRFVSTRFLIDATRATRAFAATWRDLQDSYFADWSIDERARAGDLCPDGEFDILADAEALRAMKKAMESHAE